MRVAIVVPRYGQDVLGGAESQARGFAAEAARRGWPVEVWTTCARNHYTWKNVLPVGREEQQRVTIHRFPVTLHAPARQAELEMRLASQGVLSRAEQYEWLECGAHSPLLYAHVAAHAREFDVVLVLPYAAPLSHQAAWTAPERVVFWPCLHDEPYAYLEPTSLLLENVWGVMFYSPEEGQLATRSLGMRLRRHALLGGGVTLVPVSERKVVSGSPDLLYVGRLEAGKNLSQLYDYVRQYADAGGDIRLVVIGGGPLKPPSHRAFQYRGFVSEAEKAQAYASALALCQPSLNESFSLTIMESWLAARPVLVHGDCAVTHGHVQRSKGGLWFRSYDEFVETVQWLRAHSQAAAHMGCNGREYVQQNYTWENVVNRFEQIITRWRGSAT